MEALVGKHPSETLASLSWSGTGSVLTAPFFCVLPPPFFLNHKLPRVTALCKYFPYVSWLIQ